MTDSVQKSIFDYDNYRLFLRDQFQVLKEKDKKFTYRTFAKLAGFKSAGFLILIIKGKTNLSRASISNISKALELKKDERFYFENLVLLNQSSTIEEKQLFAHQILKSKGYNRLRPTAEATYKYLTHWYYAAIQELVSLPDFKEDPEWISQRLNGKISPVTARQAIDQAVKSGYLKRNSAQRLCAADDMVISPDEVTAAFIVQYHEEFIKLGAEAIRNYSRLERDISATTFPLSFENFGKVKDILQRFRKEMVELLSLEQNADSLYQLNIQLFPLAPFKKQKP